MRGNNRESFADDPSAGKLSDKLLRTFCSQFVMSPVTDAPTGEDLQEEGSAENKPEPAASTSGEKAQSAAEKLAKGTVLPRSYAALMCNSFVNVGDTSNGDLFLSARPKIEPITWTESDSRQSSASTAAAEVSRQSVLDSIRQTQAPRRLQQATPSRGQPSRGTPSRGQPSRGQPSRGQPTRRASYPVARRATPQTLRGAIHHHPQAIPRIGGQPSMPYGQQPQQGYLQRQVPSLLGRGAGYQRGARGGRSRGGGLFRGGH